MIGPPKFEPIVQCDGKGEPVFFDRLLHVIKVPFKQELRRVDAENHQAVLRVFFVPGLNVGKRIDAIEAGIGPKVHEDNLFGQRIWTAP